MLSPGDCGFDLGGGLHSTCKNAGGGNIFVYIVKQQVKQVSLHGVHMTFMYSYFICIRILCVPVALPWYSVFCILYSVFTFSFGTTL
jgi:hypothetical protein